MSNDKPISEKQAMKKRLIHNLIELVIWVALLWICYVHLQNHPAERISFFSGYKVIYQQTEIFFQNLFGKNWEWLRQKYTLESYYQAMVILSEEKPCISSDVVKDLHETYEALQKEPKNTLEHRLQYYIDKQYEFDGELKKDCPVQNGDSEIPEEVDNIDSELEIM